MPPNEPRSYCPINLSLEIFGDTWTLLVLRDMMFGGKRHFREFLESDEHISSNILADRLARLVDSGILTKSGDPTHKQKAIYSLTPMGIDLLPTVAQLGIWGRKYLPATAQTGAQAERLEKGGAALLRKIQADLRKQHLSGVVD
jgi:DNA-binding HxlR family transcriptional regulator